MTSSAVISLGDKELCNPRMEIAIPKTNKKKVYNAKKPGVKSKDWEEIDRRTLPKVKTAIQELQKSDKPKRITVYAICALPEKIDSKKLQKTE